MEKAKLKYKELKKQLKADPNNEKLQKKFLKKKEKYKMLKKQLKKDEGESINNDNNNNVSKKNESTNEDGNEMKKRKQLDPNNSKDSAVASTPDGIASGETPKKKKRRRKRKTIPNFIPWRKLFAKAIENGGPKGLTSSALREAIVMKNGVEDAQLAEQYDFQLDKIINQGKLVCKDGNKLKLIKLLDERAKVRILEEIKQRKSEKEKKRRMEEEEYYNSIAY